MIFLMWSVVLNLNEYSFNTAHNVGLSLKRHTVSDLSINLPTTI